MKRSTADIEARSVAVIGMACRFPGASGTDELWELLRDGVDATSETPSERYDVDALYSSSPRPGPGRIGTRRAGYIDGVADFDAEFFGMSHAEATELDPQQRLLLMTAWEALEDAGQRPEDLAGSRTGVFVGSSRADYLDAQTRRGREALNPSLYHNFRAMMPARLSYVFDLRGPSVLLDTACSSSLMAVHSAVQSLRAGESPLALAAGVSLALSPDEGIIMTSAGILARDGRSKFGDAGADGYSPSDGVGVVVLKSLAAARADGDRIRAVIQGSAVSNDGRSGGALMTPSATGQVEVLRWAYEDAGISPADVDFVEAHGTGDAVLDPVEFGALGEVLGEGRPADRPCLVGSVKTNVGHAQAAGGIAGFVKAVLCLEHGEVPASLNIDSPNPRVAWDDLPLTVPAKPQPLPDHGRPAYAGVTGQGISSLNAHLVLRQGETPPAAAAAEGEPTPYVLALSARSPRALAELARSYAAYLGPGGKGSAFELRDICFSAATRRQHHAHRLAAVASSHQEMAAALRAGIDAGAGAGVPGAQERAALPAAVAERYLSGEAVNWGALFGSDCSFVPLPAYAWQTRRYWHDGQAGHADPPEEAAREARAERAAPGARSPGARTDDLAAAVLREHARTQAADYSDSSLLSDMGIDSLARLRIMLKLASDHGYDIEADELAELRTVGEFRRWLNVQEAQAA
ncbi:beta-ketoacyl synthase N-terminal-like domain-containing protein [Streptomyces sp. 6N223]|uniref:beta-ketoacyl synthase N-terminal-like domain-containing protein n=1 Tax=Streptomyces sp. 6N223 TaxID=3457412 RepID=UPI003FD028B1